MLLISNQPKVDDLSAISASWVGVANLFAAEM
jgi:hypothetical protein